MSCHFLPKVYIKASKSDRKLYYSFNDNPNEDKSSKIYFEIENFDKYNK